MDARLEMGWFFRILIGIFWVGWFYFWILEKVLLKTKIWVS
ncbi:hypothetical protein [uncultured Gammaproteobacteria bacterium]|nr:hypothetical protein [uncultured Gammaproteobacteria bacterium]